MDDGQWTMGNEQAMYARIVKSENLLRRAPNLSPP